MTEPRSSAPPRVVSGPELTVSALTGLPLIAPGSDLATLIGDAYEAREPRPNDVLVVTSKVVSKAEGRFVDLGQVEAGGAARRLAARTEKDPALVELILRESESISRSAPGVLIVRHRLGFVSANAGIDASNAHPPGAPPGSGPWVLLLPAQPDESAERLRVTLAARFPTASPLAVILSDSHGRPFRLGSVGTAIGVAGLPALSDQRGEQDLDSRVLEHTQTASADQLAAAADLVAGQAAEGRAVVLVRGLTFPYVKGRAADLVRPSRQDLYA